MYRLILDAYCNRVMFYFRDYDAKFCLNDHVTVFDYDGELPEGMNLSNCWSWKIHLNKLIYDVNEKKANNISLLTQNKEEVLKLLTNKINNIRKPYTATCNNGEYMRNIKLQEARNFGGPFLEKLAEKLNVDMQSLCSQVIGKYKEYEKIMETTEIHREFYRRKIDSVDNLEELYKLRDEIANKNLLIL